MKSIILATHDGVELLAPDIRGRWGTRCQAHGHAQGWESVAVALVALRYAGDDGQPMTLEQAGKALGVTRERVRQIEARAMRKLRVTAGVMPARAEADTERAELWQRAG